jgi:hypothetical protein
MPLDRTWYNTLIDDDGSGLTGSVWDKADVDALMDAIDAEFAYQTGNYAVWTPTLGATGGGTAAYALQSGVYARAGVVVQFGGRITLVNRGTLTGAAFISGFPFVTRGVCSQAASVAFWIGVPAGVTALGLYAHASDSVMWFSSANAGTQSNPLPAELLQPGFDVIFGGAFACN